MRTRCRRLLSAGLASLFVLGWSGTAAAGHDGWPHGRVESVVPAEGGVDISFVGTGVPDSTELRTDDLAVYLGGQRVEASKISLDDEDRPATLSRRAMLVVDTSGSMAGARLEAARSAATAYLEQVPDEVEVGLLTFAESPVVAVPPTGDREALAAGIRGLTASGNTSLYDAVLAASEALGAEGDRRVLVLSDGEDSASRVQLNAAEAAVARTGVTLDAVVLGDAPAAVAALQSLADVGRGRVLNTDDALDTAAAFESVAHEFEPRVLLHVPVPPALAGQSATLRIELGSSHGVLVDEAPVVLRQGAAEGAVGVRALALAAAVLVAVTLLLVLARRSSTGRDGERSRLGTLLATYSLEKEPEAGEDSGRKRSRLGGSLLEQGLVVADRLLQRRGWHERLAIRLDRAAVKLTPSEWVLVHGGLVLSALLLVGMLAGLLLGLVVALLVGFLAHAWVGFKAKRRSAAFTAEMPDALQLVASGLSSGYSLPQALDSVVREGREPVAGEFGRALAEARLGIPLEDALDTVATRIGSEDFGWVVMAIRVQREVGGNLAEVLTTLCQTMRDRASLRRQVKALSAEGRLSTYVLTALPFALAAYMAAFATEYWGVMWQEPLGKALLAGSVVALGLGYAWMTKLAKVEM